MAEKKKVTVTTETKKPTGLSITRSGEKFTISWKIGDKNYKDGQQVYYRTNQHKKGDWDKLTPCGATTTSKAVTLNFNNYVPHKKKILSKIRFKIRGNREEYKTETSKKETTHKCTWSDYAEKEFDIYKPKRPKVSATLSEEYANRCSFHWTAANPSKDHRPFERVQWQSRLLKDSKVTKGKDAFKKSTKGVAGEYKSGTGGASGTEVIIEDSSRVNGATPYTRWFRARSRGPGGSSKWVYTKHVYSKSNKASNVEVSTWKKDNGYLVSVKWTTSRNAAKPINSIVVQYGIGVPGAGMTTPAGLSWNDVLTLKPKDGTDKAVFTVDEFLENDQVLFVRINTQHDGVTTPGDAVIARVGALSTPTLTNVVPVEQTHRATITATNESEVPGSFLAVTYKTAAEPDAIFIGIIEPGETQAVVQAPDWGTGEKSFGVRAFVGQYTAQTRSDGVTIYTITAYDGKKRMSSGTAWDNGAVPPAPTGVAAVPTETPGTVRVSWNNPWTAADGVELSWADHADAWESTEPPESYTVSSAYAAAWNIVGLEVGKTWFIRVRLLAGDASDPTPGPWSEIISQNLASAPNIPVLTLSEAIIAADGTVTASWGFASSDGTAQAYAEICEATINETTGVITYGDPKWTTLTAQHIDINAAEAEWTTGETYNLCVRVQSASGEFSDGWSAPVPITIAEPITATITETSLADYHVVSTEADTTPYLFRPSPALTEDYDRLLLDKVVGGTLAVNQLVDITGGTKTDRGITSTIDTNTGIITLSGTSTATYSGCFNTFYGIQGHKYVRVYKILTNPNNVTIYPHAFNINWAPAREMCSADSSRTTSCGVSGFSAGTDLTGITMKVGIFDLTQMFGTAIADYVYNLEQSTAGSGVAWLKQYYPSIFSSYQPYNAGTLESVETSAHVMTGFNQFDEAWESGYYDIANGAAVASASWQRNANPIPCFPNTTYFAIQDGGSFGYFLFYDADGGYISYAPPSGIATVGTTFTTPSNAYQIKFYRQGSNAGRTLNVNFDNSSRNGEYEPYTQTSYPLDSDLVLRGIPKLNNGVPYYDGDEYKSDGTVTRKYGIVDLGTLTWAYRGDTATGLFSAGAFSDYKHALDVKCICERYEFGGTVSAVGYMSEKANLKFCLYYNESNPTNSSLYVKDTSYTDAVTFKTAMSGVYLVYELATPTTETADPYDRVQVAYKGGTEEFVSSNVVPVGHETEYAKAYDAPALTDMPLTVTITGAGETGETTVAIERAESYYLDRPDERDFTGHEGETIALFSQTGEAQITIENGDLIGTLDDGAQYRIVADVSDGIGQTAREELEFEVHWSHQAVEPTATVEIDNENLIAKITPIAPAEAYELTADTEVIANKKYFEKDGEDFQQVTPIGTENPEALGWYELNDTCDIYRLSVDRPELIFEGAEFGTMYVDPYPALGEMGGHRIVFRTSNGDYITEDNTIAWADYTQEETGGVDTMFNIIDFDGNQVRLMYDITIDAGWEKDFQQTKYLGGHIQGDWNAAVSRTGSVGGSLIVTQDQETIQNLRRLADYPGICHVRTRDGSSYAADVQVSEARDMGRDVIRSEFTLSITRVDPEGFDGLTYADWLAGTPNE